MEIMQLTEQMRVMERGLREKQQLIDELQGKKQNVDSEEAQDGATEEQTLQEKSNVIFTSSPFSPALKGIRVKYWKA